MAARLDTAGFSALLTALVWAPWPLGSNRPWAVALLALLIWVGLCCAAIARALTAVVTPVRWPQQQGRWLPLVGLIGFVLLLAMQLVPGLGDGGAAVSIDPFQTRRYLLTTLVYLGAWLLVWLSVRSPERAVHLLTTVLAAGVLQAVAAVLLYSTRSRYQLWGAEFEQGARATGTFPSPDNLAGYLELCLAAGLGWLVSQLKGTERRNAGWRASAVMVLDFMMSGKMLLRLLLAVLVIALVMTHSRMGNGVFFVALAFIGAVVALVSRELRRPALWLVASMVLVDVIIIGQWVGLERVVQRLQDTDVVATDSNSGFVNGVAAPPPREESLAQRLEVPLLSLQLVWQRPWFGHGGGTYITAFPPFKRAGMELQWDKAHNDYVQVAADTGLIGLLLWLLAGVSTAWRAGPLLRDGGQRTSRGVGVAALMALFCMGLHNMVDFNLHIPSNALTFTVLLAAVWVVPRAQRQRRRRQVGSTDPKVETGPSDG